MKYKCVKENHFKSCEDSSILTDKGNIKNEIQNTCQINSQINPSHFHVILSTNNIFRLFILLFVLQNLTKSHSLTVGPLLTTRYYELQHLETGTHDFVLTDDLTPGSDYLARFSINLVRLQLFNSALYKVISSLMHSNLFYSTTIQGMSHFYIFAYNFNATSFTLQFYITRQVQFLSIRANYLVVSPVIIQQGLIVVGRRQTFSTNGAQFPICDGLTTLNNCSFIIPNVLPHLSYKMYSSWVTIRLARNSNMTLKPAFQFKPLTQNLTSCTVSIIMEYLKLVNLDMYVLFIADTLFYTGIRTYTLFTDVLSAFPVSTVATYPITIALSHYVDDDNQFTILLGHKGEPIFYDISMSTPPDNNLTGSFYGIDNSLTVQTLVFYGFSYGCPSFITAPCQECSQYCILCDVKPTFHCVQCQTNFVLDVPQLNCSCPSPNVIMSNLCDVFPVGCISAERLSNGTAVCIFCDSSSHLILNSTNQCQCISGFQFDAMSICQDYCGDGVIYTDQCDDGNSVDGDGCNSQCQLQPGFNCDVTIQPTFCISKYLLDYQIDKIQKNEDLNRAKVYLKVSNFANLPFQVTTGNFQPLITYFSFQIFLSSSANQLTIKDIQQFNIDSDTYSIYFEFAYTFSIQNLKGQISLNYEQTRYQNYTQTLDFQLKGSNFPLIFQQNIATYKGIQTGMMVGTILNILCFIVGIITPKFIGLQTILTLQLIFYSQLLIYDPSKWPPGFIFLKYLKLASGYNDIFTYTSYLPVETVSQKFTHLQLYKSIIENFNVNFLFLVLCFVVLIVACQLRTRKQKLIEEKKKTQKKFNAQQTSPIQNQSLFFEWKFNDIVFYISNQISHWLILPLIAAISARLLIADAYNTDSSSLSVLLVDKIGRLIGLISIILILAISLNSFKNIWLSLSSLKIDFLRPEQNTYKKILLLYQWMIGILVIVFNNIYIFDALYMSIIVLLLQVFYFLLLIWINPYKQSLRVHTICLIFNNVVYLAFLILINFINYVDSLSSLLVLVFGFFILFACAFSIILTVVRLFYELKYGRELEEKIQKQRQIAQQRELEEKQQRLKKQSRFFQRQAQMRRSQAQKLRDKNIYLFQNQTKQQKQQDLIKWLKKRNWDQKLKQEEYFKQFQEKPLDQIKEQDPIKYEQQLAQLKINQQKRNKRAESKKRDEEYKRTISKLRKQVYKLKRKNRSTFISHSINIQQNPQYTMKVMQDNMLDHINTDYVIKQ